MRTCRARIAFLGLKYCQPRPICQMAPVREADESKNMSAVTGVSSSSGIAYATQLAQTSSLNRSLYNLGAAVQKGDLTSAGSILSALMKANPQYASSSADGTSAQNPVNQDFQALSDAVANNQADAAKSAWAQLQTDLAASGITTTDDGAAATAQLLAQTKSSLDQEILSASFGSTSAGSLTALIGADNPSMAGVDLSSIVSNWLTYKADGNASPPASASTAEGNVNTTA